MRDELQKTKIKSPIVTEIVPFENWWDAEEYHQKYLVNNPGAPTFGFPGLPLMCFSYAELVAHNSCLHAGGYW